MHLNDIIKTNSDRLFIVDTECFIIFTGGSINDERPFIRIGTWYDLPVEIIPLVENIIISDRILGNPSYEQFNIDVRHLEANRYIGGESILKRFLEYQRIFGLDLTNVSVVNIEKDIPELSSQKNVSDRDQFIGIFYTDGNIKIDHGGNNIFDLNAINRESLDNAGILNIISSNSKNTDRYKGAGLVIIDNNPIFYQKGYFTSYQFPDKCLHDFSVLQIDPNYIRELLLPSQNLINISGFMKFKNQRGGKIKLLSDNSEQIELIKKLFKNSTVADEKFSNLHINTPEGLKINSYLNSPNIKISFKQIDIKDEEITVPFIKSPADTARILKEKSDAILITYTAYEESALLFKSTEVPVIVIDDGNPNIRKLSESDKIVLKSGIQYDFKKYHSLEDLINEFDGLTETKNAIETFDKDKLDLLINTLLTGDSESADLLNLPGLLKAYMRNTTDRKKYSALKDLYQDTCQKIIFNPASELKSSIKVILALHNNSCCTIIKQIPAPAAEIFIDDYNPAGVEKAALNPDQQKLGRRILEDRERLMKLLGMFYKEIKETPSFGKIEKEMSLLKNEISARKDIYNNEFYSFSELRKSVSRKLFNEDIKEILQNKKITIPAAIIVIILLLSLFFLIKNRSSETTGVIKTSDSSGIAASSEQKSGEDKKTVFTVKRVDDQEKKLLQKHKVKISESDIYRYSNDVAMKNGYEKLSYDGLKDRNPHWIFPDNIFIMLDGEKVTVQKGDTLWDLCRAKLEKMNADFYKIIDEIEKTDISEKSKISRLLTEAEKFSYIKQQFEIIDFYKKRTGNE
ncbi:MAG: hypothetical protein CVV49_07735 [Spirochaetae bacterium HGW-Spirochaetae-5]|nr:MAG: hypothetical protein CVV49_07735 [Spirochaetae bacterium HGW-Spirochaetae-5]